MTDAITLTIPHARLYHGVVRLVVGGLGARLDLPIEALEDVQLAVDSLIASNAAPAGAGVTLEVDVREAGLDLAVGPFDTRQLVAELERNVPESAGVGLGRLLGTVMGGYDVETRDGHAWIRMHKPLPRFERSLAG